jgi:hypothetical protein
MMKRTVCIDFDGVIHSYDNETQHSTVGGKPVPGAFDFLKDLLQNNFTVVILSARAIAATQIDLMKAWFRTNGFPEGASLRITNIKPPALVYIDDRAFRFDGRFPKVSAIESMKPWWQKAMSVAMNDIGDNLAQALFNAEYCKQRALSMADGDESEQLRDVQNEESAALEKWKILAAKDPKAAWEKWKILAAKDPKAAWEKWKILAAKDPKAAIAQLTQARERAQSAQTHMQNSIKAKDQAQEALASARTAGADDRTLIPLEIAYKRKSADVQQAQQTIASPEHAFARVAVTQGDRLLPAIEQQFLQDARVAVDAGDLTTAETLHRNADIVKQGVPTPTVTTPVSAVLSPLDKLRQTDAKENVVVAPASKALEAKPEVKHVVVQDADTQAVRKDVPVDPTGKPLTQEMIAADLAKNVETPLRSQLKDDPKAANANDKEKAIERTTKLSDEFGRLNKNLDSYVTRVKDMGIVAASTPAQAESLRTMRESIKQTTDRMNEIAAMRKSPDKILQDVQTEREQKETEAANRKAEAHAQSREEKGEDTLASYSHKYSFARSKIEDLVKSLPADDAVRANLEIKLAELDKDFPPASLKAGEKMTTTELDKLKEHVGEAMDAARALDHTVEKLATLPAQKAAAEKATIDTTLKQGSPADLIRLMQSVPPALRTSLAANFEGALDTALTRDVQSGKLTEQGRDFFKEMVNTEMRKTGQQDPARQLLLYDKATQASQLVEKAGFDASMKNEIFNSVAQLSPAAMAKAVDTAAKYHGDPDQQRSVLRAAISTDRYQADLNDPNFPKTAAAQRELSQERQQADKDAAEAKGVSKFDEVQKAAQQKQAALDAANTKLDAANKQGLGTSQFKNESELKKLRTDAQAAQKAAQAENDKAQTELLKASERVAKIQAPLPKEEQTKELAVATPLVEAKTQKDNAASAETKGMAEYFKLSPEQLAKVPTSQQQELKERYLAGTAGKADNDKVHNQAEYTAESAKWTTAQRMAYDSAKAAGKSPEEALASVQHADKTPVDAQKTREQELRAETAEGKTGKFDLGNEATLAYVTKHIDEPAIRDMLAKNIGDPRLAPLMETTHAPNLIARAAELNVKDSRVEQYRKEQGMPEGAAAAAASFDEKKNAEQLATAEAGSKKAEAEGDAAIAPRPESVASTPVNAPETTPAPASTQPVPEQTPAAQPPQPPPPSASAPGSGTPGPADVPVTEVDTTKPTDEERRAEEERKRLEGTNPGLGSSPVLATNDLAGVSQYRMELLHKLDSRPGNPQLVAALSDINVRFVELQKARVEAIRRKPKRNEED